VERLTPRRNDELEVPKLFADTVLGLVQSRVTLELPVPTPVAGDLTVRSTSLLDVPLPPPEAVLIAV
jgi:hypothetical protein